jgi:hypothetical protein
MSPKDKVKMCPFCEGSVLIDASDCNYCGSSFAKQTQKKSNLYQQSDSLASLYDPPYSKDRTSSRFGIRVDDSNDEEEVGEKEEVKKQVKQTVKKDADEGHKLGAILLLSMGGQLFTLAWLLFFLSDDGKLSLEWSSKYWPIYLLISFLFIMQGWKKLKLVKLLAESKT